MKSPLINRTPKGFTIVEMMITSGITLLTGGMVFLALNTGLTLYAKNTAVNAAHQQARTGVDQMLANIHASSSIPQLVDSTLTPMPFPGTGPSEGLNYQRFEAGPFWVSGNVAATSTSITVYAPSFPVPQNVSGLRFNIPSHQIEKDVSAVNAWGGYRTIIFSSPIGYPVVVSGPDANGNGDGNGNGTSYITGFFSIRASYVVTGKQLRYFPTNDLGPAGDGIRNGAPTYKVIARNITSEKPFSILRNAMGGVDVRSIAAVELSTAEPQFSNRGYAAVNMFIDSYIPFRTELTTWQ